MENGVTGLYGCSCHSFVNWKEHNFFHNQVIEIGRKYKDRHSELECIVKGFSEDNSKYIKVFVEPYDCCRCNQLIHKSNLIKIEYN